MDLLGIVIGTGLLWGLTFIFVLPLTHILLQRKLAQPAYAHLNGTELSKESEAKLDWLQTRCYMLGDVLVLFTAGLILGLLGHAFVAFATRWASWPGVIAFVSASFLGVTIRPAVGLPPAM